MHEIPYVWRLLLPFLIPSAPLGEPREKAQRPANRREPAPATQGVHRRRRLRPRTSGRLPPEFLDREFLDREGIRKTIAYLQQLDALGAGFRSYTEPYLNTENELVRHILLGVLSYLAELEAKKISRRTKAGLERAGAEGKELGRRSKFDEHREALEAILEEGCSKAEMKRRTGLAYNAVKKYLRRIEQE